MREHSKRRAHHSPAESRSAVRRQRGSAAALLALGLLAGAPIASGATTVSPELPDLSRAPALEIRDGRLELALEDAIAIALERNLSLVVERFATQEADLTIDQNLGIFDLMSTADLSQLDETTPTTSSLQAGVGVDASTVEAQSLDLGISQLVPSGGSFVFDWSNNRQETNSLFSTLNPSYRVDVDFSFSQPLLRDFGRDITKRGIRIARTSSQISRETFELQVALTIRSVDEAYWNLVEALEQLKVAEESLALARELHEQNKIRVEVGTLAPLELVQSEAGVASRQEEIIRTRALVGDREDLLRQLLNLEQDGLWNMPVSPTTDPEMEPVEIDVAAAIESALAERPELRSKELSQLILETDSRFFRNQLLPQLDVSLTYGLNGIGGDLTERNIFTGEILRQAAGDYGDALSQVTSGDFDAWRIGLNFAYPVQNRTARAQSAIADIAVERGEAELNDLRLGVVTEVRRVSRAVEAAAEAIASARVSRRLEEKNYEAEQKRYENGMSTSFQVLQIQEDLTAARSRYVSAVTTYRKALALYYRAIGRLIEESGVQIAGD